MSIITYSVRNIDLISGVWISLFLPAHNPFSYISRVSFRRVGCVGGWGFMGARESGSLTVRLSPRRTGVLQISSPSPVGVFPIQRSSLLLPSWLCQRSRFHWSSRIQQSHGSTFPPADSSEIVFCVSGWFSQVWGALFGTGKHCCWVCFFFPQ